MGSLFEELEAREAAARVRVEELEAAITELSGKLVLARDGLERLRITRETVADVLAEITPEAEVPDLAAPAATASSPVAPPTTRPVSHSGSRGVDRGELS
ncbi:hypothetical protein [Streptomyces sp. NPDC001770]